MKNPAHLLDAAIRQHANGDLHGAIVSYKKILKKESSRTDASHHLGIAYLQLGNPAEAVHWIQKSLNLDSQQPTALSNLGYCFNLLNRYAEAINACSRATKLDPHNEAAWTNLGNAQKAMKLLEDATNSYQKALDIQPTNPKYLYNLANIFYDREDLEKAQSLFKQCLSINPRLAEGHNNLSGCLLRLNQLESALEHAEFALQLKPNYTEAWSNRGNVLISLNRFDEALISAEKALTIQPNYAQGWSTRAVALTKLMRYEEALVSHDKALELRPEVADAWSSKGGTLNALHRHNEAAHCYLKAEKLGANDQFNLGRAHHQMMLVCNWHEYHNHKKAIEDALDQGRYSAEPFGYQGIADSEASLLKCASLYCEKKFPADAARYTHRKTKKQRIKIGYLCGEFRNQATSHLMTGVWENHNLDKFEIYGFDSGWGDESSYRKRILNAIPNFFDISRVSDGKASDFIHSKGIDILVNLNGYFGNSRQGIFASKPAPISVNYLGFPGTTGATYMDYLIADEEVIPTTSREFYTEKIVYLPFSYQANDNKRKISPHEFSRAQMGLPDNDFIFCCFNNAYKITPDTFLIWMEILNDVDKSCLWILADDEDIKTNLRMSARKCGVEPSRLIFASRMPPDEHIGRHKLADLFLDTLPYNAHTTASDSLWGELPLISLKGHTFPGRVGASLLRAVGLPELITHTTEDYKKLAIHLAKNPDQLAKIKTKLMRNRLTSPFFDTALFTQHLESAFEEMHTRFMANLPVEHFSVMASRTDAVSP